MRTIMYSICVFIVKIKPEIERTYMYSACSLQNFVSFKVLVATGRWYRFIDIGTYALQSRHNCN